MQNSSNTIDYRNVVCFRYIVEIALHWVIKSKIIIIIIIIIEPLLCINRGCFSPRLCISYILG